MKKEQHLKDNILNSILFFLLPSNIALKTINLRLLFKVVLMVGSYTFEYIFRGLNSAYRTLEMHNWN